MKITLNMKTLSTPMQVHEYLQRALSFPDYYGKNLDALHDVLTDWDQPVTLAFVLPPETGEMSAFLPRFRRVLADAAAENPRLRVQVR